MMSFFGQLLSDSNHSVPRFAYFLLSQSVDSGETRLVGRNCLLFNHLLGLSVKATRQIYVEIEEIPLPKPCTCMMLF